MPRSPKRRRSSPKRRRSPKRSTKYSDMKLQSIKPSTRAGKKKMAVFINKKTGRTKTTHFGARGMSDYTIHKDKERRERYISRHKSRENWKDPTSAGALSRWVLWSAPSLRGGIANYKKQYPYLRK